MALEIGVGLAHLSGRKLSMDLNQPLGRGPGDILKGSDSGRPSAIGDLFDVPVQVASTQEWNEEVAASGVQRLPWPSVNNAVFVTSEDVDLETEKFRDFANGRSCAITLSGRLEEAPNVELRERALSWYSYFFYVPGPERTALYKVLNSVTPKVEFRDLANRVVADLGSFNAAHIRRTDILLGIPASRSVTPWQIAENLAEVLPRDEPLLVCSEASSDSGVFGPLREMFPETEFLTDLLMGPRWRGDFLTLPRHDDQALGLVTQEVASRSGQFVGTLGSTFTGAIQRARLLEDPAAPFLFVADYTTPGPLFRQCRFEETSGGSFSWNREAHAMSADMLGWFRDWPESNTDLWPS